MAISIWRDTYVQAATAGVPATFQIRTENSLLTGELIYIGTVYPKDSSSKPQFKINDICADYLSTELPDVNDIEFVENLINKKTFYVFATQNGTTVLIGSKTFIMDWSYDRDYSNTDTFSSCPIRKTFVQGQTLFISYNDAPTTITGTIYNADGSTVDIQEPRSADADLNDDLNDDFFIDNQDLDPNGTLAINLSHYPNAVKVVFGDMVFNRQPGCYRYVLHYVNAFGGWDSIWMSSGVITDSYKRSTIQRLTDNITSSSRRTVNFANTYTQKYQFHTGWLLNTEGELMHHLLGSTNVYLEDMQTARIHSLNITDTSCEYKSYRSNGAKLVDYTINCELSQSRRRQ